MESIFEFLFKYRPLLFERGDFAFSAPRGVLPVALALMIGSVVIGWTYLRARGRSRPVDRAVLLGTRVLIFAVLLFCLFRPVLLVQALVPQHSYLAVLIDDSRSMHIADDGAEPRTAFIDQQLGMQGELTRSLEDRFRLRYYRFSDVARRLPELNDLAYAGRSTRIGDAIDFVRDDLSGSPLSGVVVVSDGGDNSPDGMAPSLLPMKAAGVPVYAVGLGRERLERDVQLTRVETPRTVLQGSAIAVDAIVSANGYGGQQAVIDVEDDGRIVSRDTITLPEDGKPATVRVKVAANEPGPRRFRFRIAPREGELVAENNVQDAVIVVERRREKILYFEGEPRFELKFIRRAVEADSNLQVVALQRTADSKFLRLDVDNADELAGGFPKTREELFSYRAVILGSVEASFFSHEQLQMLAEFVSRRGGGLLALGGRNAFSQGGYAGTPLAEALPVVLDERDRALHFVELKVRPTRAGSTHPAMQLAESEQASVARWETLPPLTSINRITAVKPGATTLLTGAGETGEQVVLAYQRYGRGAAFAMPIQDSWLWQMHADVPLEDMTHERLWRQLLRWLVQDVPNPVVASAAPDQVSPAESFTITAEVDDSSFVRVNDASVIATVTAPDGTVSEVPLEWVLARDGEYRGRYTPREPGLHDIRIAARKGDVSLGEDRIWVNSTESNAEYFDAHLHSDLLKRIADETGGRYYTPATVKSLAEDVRYTGRGDTVTERKDLWDMPIVFLLLVSLIAFEWVYRRARGLA